MRRIGIIFLLITSFISGAFAQNSKIDSIDKLLRKAVTDTGRINLEIEKINILSNINLDSAITLSLITMDKAKKINYYRGEVSARETLVGNYIFKGNYSAANDQLNYLSHFIKTSKDSSDYGDMYGKYGFLYSAQNKYDSSILYYEKAIGILERAKKTSSLNTNYINIAVAYEQQSNFPVALSYLQKTLKNAEADNNEIDEAYAYVNMAIIYAALSDTIRAENTYLKAAALGKRNQLKNVELYAYSNLSSLYIDLNKWRQAQEFAMKAAVLGQQMGDQGIEASSLSRAAISLANSGQPDSAIQLSDKSIAVADSSGQPLNIYQTYTDRGSILKLQKKWKEAIPFYEKGLLSAERGDIYTLDFGARYKELSECYEITGNPIKALRAFKKSALIVDSVRSRDNIQKSTELTMNYEFEKKQQVLKTEQRAKDDIARTKQRALIIGLALAFALAIVAFIGFRNKQKANILLNQHSEEIQNTLTKLKSTQVQLIQSEKMASLGELTAGIAHEIQNPLNFVNNFSEVNKELIAEMREEIAKGNYGEVNALAKNIEDNQEKINHHGKRAEIIVKGMLQHSRTSSGKKELTDINKLADEYLRLSYHGLRAKDKSLNAILKTDYDETIGNVPVIPQDIGRVLLNLYNNAFYVVSERKKQQPVGFEPGVLVSTKKINDKIEIKVRDNGSGIPQKLLDKIFQPFFTTKPTGQGTGLGLSLAYDIVKAHGGELKVETKEGEGAEFIIELPIK